VFCEERLEKIRDTPKLGTLSVSSDGVLEIGVEIVSLDHIRKSWIALSGDYEALIGCRSEGGRHLFPA
jgi:hypothetical protein